MVTNGVRQICSSSLLESRAASAAVLETSPSTVNLAVLFSIRNNFPSTVRCFVYPVCYCSRVILLSVDERIRQNGEHDMHSSFHSEDDCH